MVPIIMLISWDFSAFAMIDIRVFVDIISPRRWEKVGEIREKW
jgi:hypothetical protein